MKRSTMEKEGLKDVVLVDGIIVGQGYGCKKCFESCKALMNELNDSDEKCDIVKEMFISNKMYHLL